tara:strand:- start:199 stop:1083 length:885 start_codon:yes stop_codon:yes gene_type:complete
MMLCWVVLLSLIEAGVGGAVPTPGRRLSSPWDKLTNQAASQLDRNGDGKIDGSDAASLLDRNHDGTNDSRDLDGLLDDRGQGVLDKLDVNGDGVVDGDDAKAAGDLNGDGTVDGDDLTAVGDVNGDGTLDHNDALDAIGHKLDTNGDGQVGRDELSNGIHGGIAAASDAYNRATSQPPSPAPRASPPAPALHNSDGSGGGGGGGGGGGSPALVVVLLLLLIGGGAASYVYRHNISNMLSQARAQTKPSSSTTDPLPASGIDALAFTELNDAAAAARSVAPPIPTTGAPTGPPAY